jgi:UDPglucose 6-dehydrogenase
VVLTEWNEFRGLDLRRLAAAMRRPVMLDFRNIYLPADIERTPFIYHSVGRPLMQKQPIVTAQSLPQRTTNIRDRTGR